MSCAGLAPSIEPNGPYLILAKKNHAVTFGGGGGLVALGDFAGRAAGQGRDPDALVDALRKAGGIGVVTMHFKIAAADEDDASGRQMVQVICAIS